MAERKNGPVGNAFFETIQNKYDEEPDKKQRKLTEAEKRLLAERARELETHFQENKVGEDNKSALTNEQKQRLAEIAEKMRINFDGEKSVF